MALDLEQLDPIMGVALYAVANIVITSVCPIPLGVFMIVAAALLWGAMLGGVLYISTCAIGSAITFELARCLRPRLLGRLSEQHRQTFNTLDAALVEDGATIAILWRIAPIAPFVLSSALISLTSITRETYLWTTLVGCVPSALPILLGAQVAGRAVVGDESDRSPLALAISVLSVLAAVLLAVKLGRVAVATFRRHGVAAGADDDKEGDDTPAADEAGGPAAQSAQVWAFGAPRVYEEVCVAGQLTYQRRHSAPPVLTRRESWSEATAGLLKQVSTGVVKEVSRGVGAYRRTVSLL